MGELRPPSGAKPNPVPWYFLLRLKLDALDTFLGCTVLRHQVDEGQNTGVAKIRHSIVYLYYYTTHASRNIKGRPAGRRLEGLNER
jgi:hypothetical protein